MRDSDASASDVEPSPAWFDAVEIGIEGRGWNDTPDPFSRLPARAEGVVPQNVWLLSRQSAGMYVRFRTDASRIVARWSLRRDPLSRPFLPVNGRGLDLYAMNDGDNRYRWAGSAAPELTIRPGEQVERRLAEKLAPGMRSYIVYGPVHDGLTSLHIGIDAEAQMLAPLPWTGGSKPVCVYGTSIVQSGTASGPGLAYPHILGRLLNRPMIPLGFAGNARAEIAIFELLAELDPCAYVIDPLPNMTTQQVTERIEPGVRLLRQARPTTPIVLVENIIGRSPKLHDTRVLDAKNSALRAAHERLVSSGVTRLTLAGAAGLLGDDSEGVLDGTHPNDIGFLRLAQGLAAPVAQAICEGSAGDELH